MGGRSTSRSSGRGSPLDRIGALSYRWRFWILGVWALALAAFFPTLRALDHHPSTRNAGHHLSQGGSEMPRSGSPRRGARHVVGAITSKQRQTRGAITRQTHHRSGLRVVGTQGPVVPAGQSDVESQEQTVVSITQAPAPLFPALNPVTLPIFVPQLPAPAPLPSGIDEKVRHEHKAPKHHGERNGKGEDTRGFRRDDSKRHHGRGKARGKGKDSPKHDRPDHDAESHGDRHGPKHHEKHAKNRHH